MMTVEIARHGIGTHHHLSDSAMNRARQAFDWVTNARDQPCIHGTRDCIISMHGSHAGLRR